MVDRAAPILKGPLGDTALGRVDLLFELVRKLSMATPGDIADYISALSADTERRAVAEQIVDEILAEDNSRYQTYEEIRLSHQINVNQDEEEAPAVSEIFEAIGLFLAQWVLLEQRFRGLTRSHGYSKVLMPTTKLILDMGLLTQEKMPEFERIRRLRNAIVHGTWSPGLEDIREATLQLQQILGTLPNP